MRFNICGFMCNAVNCATRKAPNPQFSSVGCDTNHSAWWCGLCDAMKRRCLMFMRNVLNCPPGDASESRCTIFTTETLNGAPGKTQIYSPRFSDSLQNCDARRMIHEPGFPVDVRQTPRARENTNDDVKFLCKLPVHALLIKLDSNRLPIGQCSNLSQISLSSPRGHPSFKQRVHPSLWNFPAIASSLNFPSAPN